MASNTVLRLLAVAPLCMRAVLSERLTAADLALEEERTSVSTESLGSPPLLGNEGTVLKSHCTSAQTLGGLGQAHPTCSFKAHEAFAAGGFGTKLAELGVSQAETTQFIESLNPITEASSGFFAKFKQQNLDGKELAHKWSDKLHAEGKLADHEVYFFTKVYEYTPYRQETSYVLWDHYVTVKEHKEGDAPPFFESTISYDRYCCCKDESGKSCKFKYSNSVHRCNKGFFSSRKTEMKDERVCIGTGGVGRDAPAPPS